MKSHARFAYAVILASFFVSGLAGLLYQVVWTRYLALFLGHTSYAVIAVLAAFMGGLALGNACLGALADRVRRPLLFYAGLELGIGLFALGFPAYYELVHGWFIALVRGLEPGGSARLALQFFFAALTILLPTVLMGATLPALTKFATQSLAELRGRVAVLYAINSSGAVLGVILTDWWWIPGLGLELTLYLGAAMSLAVGVVAFLLSRGLREGAPVGVPAPSAAAEPVELFSPPELRLALIGIGISGFVAMVYEVAWTRLLGLALGSSTHAYSLMLATFISGIAAGGWVVSRWRRQANTLVAFGVAELALAGTLFVSIWFYDLLPYWFAQLAERLARRPDAYPLYELAQALICFAVMFLPAFCLGTTLPLASRVATSEFARTGRSVGRVFAVNTLGTVLGAVLGGLVLLPWLGLAGTFAVGIALNALVGAAILAQRFSPGRAWWWAPIVLVLVVGGSAMRLEPHWQKVFALGLWRAPRLPESIEAYRGWVADMRLRYHRDGAGSTVTVIAVPRPDGPEHLMLRVNGKTDATSLGDMSTQVLLAHIPMLLKPDSTDALVVGAGSGMSVASLLRHPTITNVDVVEISPEVVAASREHFGPVSDHALDDARVKLTVEDAKTFIQVTPRKFDLIITEPSNPWMAGVAAVFSVEYYESIRDRLKPGGLAAQWLQIYESNDRTVDLVVNTFSSVFANVGVWQVGASDLLLLGSVGPLKPDLDALAQRMRDPLVQGDLARVGVTSPAALLMLELIPHGDGSYLPEPNTAVHSDLRPTLEYEAQRAFFVRQNAQRIFQVSEPRLPRPRLLLTQWRQREPAGTNELRAAADLFRASSIPEPDLFRSQMRRWIELDPDSATALELLIPVDEQVPPQDGVAAALGVQPGFRAARAAGNLQLMRAEAKALMARHRWRRTAYYLPPTEELEGVLQALIVADPVNRRVHRARLAEVYWDRGDDAQFLPMALKVFAANDAENGPYGFAADPSAPRFVLARMLLHFERRGDTKSALKLIEEAVRKGFAGDEAQLREPVLEFQARRILGNSRHDSRLP